MTDAVTLTDLAEALGVTKQAVSQRATRESWASSEETVRGGRRLKFPIATLPAPIRRAVISHRTEALISSSTAPHEAVALPVAASNRSAATGLSIPCADMTDKQRAERDARNGVLAAIKRVCEATGASREAAITTLLVTAQAGGLNPALDAMLRLARDPRGRAGNGYPTSRTLKRWLVRPDLAPSVPQKDMGIPSWASGFLKHYQVPTKISVMGAYREWLKNEKPINPPSLHQVRRFLDKLGTVTRERGRMGNRELKNIRPFVRRDFSHLEPNDIWTADGHTFDAEVQHPLHGRPFRPEITTIIDVATRRAVGWSVDLAESSIAVADALRYGVERHGVPAIFYVDNGSGYANAMLKDEATGLLGRIGTEIRHSLPYNSQARGVIERAHQTIWVQAAKLLPSYVGAAMDREARLAQFKLTRQALKKGGAMPLIPWDVFVQFAEVRVAEYNAAPHRSLKGVSPDLSLRAFEAKGWKAEAVSAESLQTLFRPRVTRTIQRAEIHFATNIYFARELAEFHGVEAHIAYDIHDPSKVWVYTPEGRFICAAEADGNRRHYMPVSVVQQARERRAKGRLARVDAKRDEILEELHGAPAINAPGTSQIVIAGRVIDTEALAIATEQEPAAAQASPEARADRASAIEAAGQPAHVAAPKERSERTAAENYAEWVELDARVTAGEEVSDADARWHRTYPTSAQYRAEAGRRKAAA